MKGALKEKDKLSPGYISLKNPKYIEIDGKFYSGLFVVDYPREFNYLILTNILKFNRNIKITYFFEKQDFYNTIKLLTYHIGNTSVDLSDGNKNREDIDLIAFSNNDAKYIRREMQINNEEMYYLYTYILVCGKSVNELECSLKEIEELCITNGLDVKRSYFRQEEIFKSLMPFNTQNEIIKKQVRRNILTNGIKSTYPFITSRIVDEKGILIGKSTEDNSLIIVDKFKKDKYKNSNIAIFGTSGAGKSYFTKTMIIRSFIFDIEQLIIDPEREYENICKNLNGEYIKFGPKSKNYINIFDIREEDLEEEVFFENVIEKVKSFLLLILGKDFEKDIYLIEELIIKTYEKKGINENKESMYKENGLKIKNEKDMPILEDLYEIVKIQEKYNKFEKYLFPYVKGSMKFFNNYTNINLDNKLIVADIYDLGEDNLIYGMYLCVQIFWSKIQKNRKQKKCIYIDEIWRLIGMNSNKYVASFVYKIFKTIRKYSGSAVAITQDISDLFLLEDGKYGKCIINNTSFKFIFSLEEENIKILEKNMDLNENEKIKIKSLRKGENLAIIEKDHVLLNIISSDFEKEMIDS